MKRKKILNQFLIIAYISCFLLLITLLISTILKEKQIETKQEKQTVSSLQTKQEMTKQEVSFLPLEKEIVQTYAKYPVVAQLEIPKINIDTPVLQSFSEKAMKKCVTKLTGGKPNEIGNFCIIGHNYVRKNMFSKLKQLEEGDSIYLSDRVHGTLKYLVESLSIVEPEDVSCLSQQDNYYELTLITCTSDSLSRVVVKAKAETKTK